VDPFRDDREVLRQRVEAMEQELEETREELAKERKLRVEIDAADPKKVAELEEELAAARVALQQKRRDMKAELRAESAGIDHSRLASIERRKEEIEEQLEAIEEKKRAAEVALQQAHAQLAAVHQQTATRVDSMVRAHVAEQQEVMRRVQGEQRSTIADLHRALDAANTKLEASRDRLQEVQEERDALLDQLQGDKAPAPVKALVLARKVEQQRQLLIMAALLIMFLAGALVLTCH
jgi:chromosome segregation ATPase